MQTNNIQPKPNHKQTQHFLPFQFFIVEMKYSQGYIFWPAIIIILATSHFLQQLLDSLYSMCVCAVQD